MVVLAYKSQETSSLPPSHLHTDQLHSPLVSSTASSSLFEPLQVGQLTLQHRVVMAPLTRYRADENHIHGDMAVQYYSQRTEVLGLF